MYAGRDFDPSDSGEAEFYKFDYTAILGLSETIASAVWTCSVVTGTDPAAASHISGSASVIPGKYGAASAATQQLVSGLVPGVQYRLQSMATTSLGQSLSLWSHVSCAALA